MNVSVARVPAIDDPPWAASRFVPSNMFACLQIRIEDPLWTTSGGIDVIPLGVDSQLFHPNLSGSGGESIFHLSSTEARDMTTLVIRVYARALSLAPDLPDLLIGGSLGAQRERICEVAGQTESIGDFTFSDGSRMKTCGSATQAQLCAFSPRSTRDLDFNRWKLLHAVRRSSCSRNLP